MDGVLTDSEPLINAAAIAMFKEKGLTVQPEDFLPFVGTGEDRYLGGVAEKYQFPLDLPAAKARTYEIYLQLVPLQLKAFPGARELVAACRQAGLRLAVASSADQIKIDANLHKIGLPPEMWDAVISGEAVINKKPAPDIFLRAAERLGFSPGQCVVVEDAVNGVHAAKAAGMRCVAVAQSFPAERLRDADLVRQKISDLTLADLLGRQDVVPHPSSLGPPPAALERVAETPVRPWGFWATLGLTAAMFLAEVIAQAVIIVVWLMASHSAHPGAAARKAAFDGLLLSVGTCGSVPLLLFLAWIFARIRAGSQALSYLGLRPVPRSAYLRWSIPMLVLLALSDLLTYSLGREIVPPSMVQAYETAGFLPLFWLTLMVAAPLGEETLFRGFFFEGLLHSRLGALGAILLSSLFWALIHVQYDAYGIATIFVTGLFLGYARLKTQSLYVPIFLHSLNNLGATLELLWFTH